MTARLLDQIQGTVFTLGDNAYESGTAKQFRDCYDPTWGRHKARTRPSPGNHDYVTPGAAAYYDYFGESAGPDRHGYYSFELGAWHIVSLNSEIDAGPESAQAQWLAADLAAHPAACTLAYWHKPIFSSGSVHGNDPHMRPIWNILAHAGADVVVNYVAGEDAARKSLKRPGSAAAGSMPTGPISREKTRCRPCFRGCSRSSAPSTSSSTTPASRRTRPSPI